MLETCRPAWYVTNLDIVEYAPVARTSLDTAPIDIAVRLESVPWGTEHRRALIASSQTLWQTLSWASRGGGNATGTTYCCFQVNNADLPLNVDPQTVIDRLASAVPLVSPVVALTSADVGAYCVGQASEQDVAAFALVTTGFANALRVGERGARQGTRPQPDTINIACWLNCSLTFEARLEALSIITQARTLSVLEAKIESSDGSGLATGTGTDCIALFTKMPNSTVVHPSATDPTNDPSMHYAGMHTCVGRVLGKAVRDAMDAAATRWAHKHEALLTARRVARTT